MPSARIRPPVRKSRREAHGGARPFAKPEKASEAFLVPGRIVAGGAKLAEQGFLRRQALRQKSNGHHRARPQRREGLPLPRDRLLRRHADRLDDRDLPGFGLGQRHALQSVPPRPQRGSPRSPFGSRMSLPMARLDWVDGQIRIRPIHVEKGCSPESAKSRKTNAATYGLKRRDVPATKAIDTAVISSSAMGSSNTIGYFNRSRPISRLK